MEPLSARRPLGSMACWETSNHQPLPAAQNTACAFGKQCSFFLAMVTWLALASARHQFGRSAYGRNAPLFLREMTAYSQSWGKSLGLGSC